MSSSRIEPPPARALNVKVTDDSIVVELADGRTRLRYAIRNLSGHAFWRSWDTAGTS